MTEQETPELELEDDILAYTHNKRKFIINEMMRKGLPADPDETKIVLTALKDMDGVALGRKRIKAEEKVNANQEQAAALITQVLEAMQGKKPYQFEGEYRRELPTLSADIPEPILVDGETAEVLPQQNYESFIAEYGDND